MPKGLDEALDDLIDMLYETPSQTDAGLNEWQAIVQNCQPEGSINGKYFEPAERVIAAYLDKICERIYDRSGAGPKRG